MLTGEGSAEEFASLGDASDKVRELEGGIKKILRQGKLIEKI